MRIGGGKDNLTHNGKSQANTESDTPHHVAPPGGQPTSCGLSPGSTPTSRPPHVSVRIRRPVDRVDALDSIVIVVALFPDAINKGQQAAQDNGAERPKDQIRSRVMWDALDLDRRNGAPIMQVGNQDAIANAHGRKQGRLAQQREIVAPEAALATARTLFLLQLTARRDGRLHDAAAAGTRLVKGSGQIEGCALAAPMVGRLLDWRLGTRAPGRLYFFAIAVRCVARWAIDAKESRRGQV